MITGKARVAGVIGWPVGHSRSPRLHGFWLARHGIDGAYVPLAVAPEALERALAALPALGLAGVNVTVPHKEHALARMDALTERARRIGAVNTIVCQSDGRLLGDNTDGFGFLENLRQRRPDWRAGHGPAVVLGAGGAARAVCASLLEAGCPALTLVNRDQGRARALAEALAAWSPVPITLATWDEAPRTLGGAALLVNTTSLGMVGQPPLDLDLRGLAPSALVTDIVYAPLETPLLARARALGLATVDGLGMLLHQGRPGFEAWFGVAPEVDDALRAAVLGKP
ncbi:shikimate dehydrogenase [Rhodospirillum rubrum]|uniref:Shikimate dehydrogenase (NADP(+)) n=1 Tax=Rhodospirillum rubrum (strain ATCC 11170 / ATH 1.1.1 / DSM 467 / LMG 4362 / NCIMB 8255 / S1) TaxID=269796 RepID=AROE_RHORT|nr:shikimate dehydrogenase [Rhodospirillum rubrum]Q2RN88.1 RecName: Full=Shikimate dehydrogenase (NADP(+)); Short=SDH [Rhodospirillum rubrum ATCC 11170]ABC24407.1 shikimate dehydrogenase [Rhodospirillum rubrum ATCC 11170]AEO50158.1 shikimate 5-dehydrogenase [Rhodospirillum rubrum F11]MBK5956127.1 shikimate dehydrogenase [Rhodospirillum rubrum]QXG80330.1 shikimate dehydrogenase [Rhodospirillum rubrum]HAQ00077.1 shikimate dehydrogenase [Rhodospirillum rubrum]